MNAVGKEYTMLYSGSPKPSNIKKVNLEVLLTMGIANKM